MRTSVLRGLCRGSLSRWRELASAGNTRPTRRYQLRAAQLRFSHLQATAQISEVPDGPARPLGSHKGTYGTVVVVGGASNMIGAPAISATAALRAGVGLCKVLTDRTTLPHVLTAQPSATGVFFADTVAGTLTELDKADGDKRAVLAIGPGLGQEHENQLDLVVGLLRSGRRAVLDADGLNTLANYGKPLADERQSQDAPALVLTPHPGEYRRLAKPLNIELSPTADDQRIAAAAALARAHNAVVVLKGQGTVVSDGTKHYINQSGNPALSTAGTGDVLTGLIASLLAQGMSGFDAAVLGVHVHGKAADAWAEKAGPAGMLAMELAHAIPQALNPMRAK